MSDWLLAGIGLLAGLALGTLGTLVVMLVRRGQARTELARARMKAELLETDLDRVRQEAGLLRARQEETQQHLAVREERVKTLEHAENRLRETFLATGAEALQVNTRQFLELASKTFEAAVTEARGDIESRRAAVEGLIRPIRELLEKHGAAVSEIERKREVAYSGLEEQIRQIAVAHGELRSETGRLVTALRRPEQRGRWGEMQLRNVVELAGMTKHCDFSEQSPTDDPATQDRPDMIVLMPGGGRIVVDSKVALDAFLDSLQPDSDRAAQLKRHTELVERHYRRLASKRYWDQFDHTPKLVVMFMPLESALAAALDVRPTLHADAMKQHVLIATPTLLVALLRAVAYGWQQDAVTDNARQIAKIGGELYERMATFVDHFEEIGRRLSQSTEAYNRAVGSLATRMLPSARKLREMDATMHDEIEPPPAVEIEPRQGAWPSTKRGLEESGRAVEQ